MKLLIVSIFILVGLYFYFYVTVKSQDQSQQAFSQEGWNVESKSELVLHDKKLIDQQLSRIVTTEIIRDKNEILESQTLMEEHALINDDEGEVISIGEFVPVDIPIDKSSNDIEIPQEYEVTNIGKPLVVITDEYLASQEDYKNNKQAYEANAVPVEMPVLLDDELDIQIKEIGDFISAD